MSKFKTVVLILAHCNANYVLELAKCNCNTYFIVHFDVKAKIDMSIFKNVDLHNLDVIEDRVSVFWGGGSQIMAMLKLLDAAIKINTASYIHLISAECYPLISFSDMEIEWDQDPLMNYMESHIRTDNEWRVKTWMPHADTKHMRTFSGRVLKKILRFSSCFINSSGITEQPYFGSQWFSINKKLAERIVLKNKTSNYFQKFSRITCADEHAFPMFVRAFDIPKVSNDNKRYIEFLPGASSPSYLDIDKVMSINTTISNKYWFARKFNEQEMINKLKDNFHE